MTTLIRLRGRMSRLPSVIPAYIKSSNPWSITASARLPTLKLPMLFPQTRFTSTNCWTLGTCLQTERRPLDDRLLFRKDWFRGAMNALQDTKLVFFYPGNGMEIQSMKAHEDGGPKYVWYDKLKPFFERGQSLVVYQHGDHSGAEQAIKRRASELRDKFKCGPIWAMR